MSLALQDGKGLAMDLHFPSVFSEDETMWIDVDVYCGLPSLVVQASIGWAMDLRFPFVFSEDETMRIVGPLGWKRIGNGSSLSLYIQ